MYKRSLFYECYAIVYILSTNGKKTTEMSTKWKKEDHKISKKEISDCKNVWEEKKSDCKNV